MALSLQSSASQPALVQPACVTHASGLLPQCVRYAILDMEQGFLPSASVLIKEDCLSVVSPCHTYGM